MHCIHDTYISMGSNRPHGTKWSMRSHGTCWGLNQQSRAVLFKSCDSFALYFAEARVSYCDKYSFYCERTLCIPLRYKCDGVPDCPNRNDESEETCGEQDLIFSILNQILLTALIIHLFLLTYYVKIYYLVKSDFYLFYK